MQVITCIIAVPPTLNALEEALKADSPRRLITRLYTTMQKTAPITQPKACAACCSDLQVEITEEKWKYCCAQLMALSPNYKLRLIHFRFLHRLYRTPVQLYKMGLKEDNTCWRCVVEGAAFMHEA